MKNLMNHVDTIRDESLDGLAAAHAEIVVLGAERGHGRATLAALLVPSADSPWPARPTLSTPKTRNVPAVGRRVETAARRLTRRCPNCACRR